MGLVASFGCPLTVCKTTLWPRESDQCSWSLSSALPEEQAEQDRRAALLLGQRHWPCRFLL